MQKFMSGIKPTGKMHLGNYVNIIKPILEHGPENTIVLVADGHALTSEKDIYSKKIELIKTLCSFGIKNIVCQSDIPEIKELMWILSCYTEKGFMNRAHGYKSAMVMNETKKTDQDHGINVGLYTYPILMAADLTIFDVEGVFIGKDQVQHVEIAKDIVRKFNNAYDTDILKVPEPHITAKFMLPGYDGQKMSKSYNNTIPLMESEMKLRENIFSVKTNHKNIGEPKEWNESPITQMYSCFATQEKCEELIEKMQQGIGWGEVKKVVFDEINVTIGKARNSYDKVNWSYMPIMNHKILEEIRKKTTIKMNEVKEVVYGRPVTVDMKKN